MGHPVSYICSCSPSASASQTSYCVYTVTLLHVSSGIGQCDWLGVVVHRASTWMDSHRGAVMCSFLLQHEQIRLSLQSQCRIHECSISCMSPMSTRPACCLRRPLRHTAVHVGHPLSLSLRKCKVFRSLFTLSTVGQTCPGGVLKAPPDHCVPPLNFLWVITGLQGDWRSHGEGSTLSALHWTTPCCQGRLRDNWWMKCCPYFWVMPERERDRKGGRELLLFHSSYSNLHTVATETRLCPITSCSHKAICMYAFCKVQYIKATSPRAR